MPVHVTLLPSLRLVIAEAKGLCTRADVQRYFSDVRDAGAGAFGKLFDISHAKMEVTERDIADFVQATKDNIQSGHAGPIAFVVGDEAGRALVLPFLDIPGIERFGAIFEDRQEARRWLDKMLAETARKAAS
jgi:hypothetical protein